MPIPDSKIYRARFGEKLIKDKLKSTYETAFRSGFNLTAISDKEFYKFKVG